MQAALVRLGLSFCVLVSGVLAGAAPLVAQDAHRIWAQVRTTTGETHTGFIRWDRNEGSWVDILDGSKNVREENYEVWLEANRDGQRPTRTVELKGYRISWDEADPDFPMKVSSGLQFGHLSSVVPTGRDSVTVVLRNGRQMTLSGGSTDIGPSMRDLIVDVPGRQQVELEWEDVARVDFGPVPAGAIAQSPRLYGIVSDTAGRSYTGFVSWDLDEIFESDVVDGRDEEGDDRDIPFAEIRAIEAHRRSATLTLKTGQTVELSGTNDVNRGSRGIQLSDPALGMVEVEWEELRSVQFQNPPTSAGYDSFGGGHPLSGTVTTQEGEELTGLIRWDADEESSWELLDGRSKGVLFKIEFSNIDQIVRSDVSGAHVTLVDGRTFELDDSNDVDWDNKGILVAVDAIGEELTSPPTWRYVSWEEFREIRFALRALPVDSKDHP